MEEGDEKNKETYVVGALGDVHATWRMNDFKMSVVVTTWESKNALKIRLEEKKTQVSLNSLTNLGEVLYSQNQSYYFKDPTLPFIGRRTDHYYKGSLQEKLCKVAFLTLPIQAPKWRVKRHLLDPKTNAYRCYTKEVS